MYILRLEPIAVPKIWGGERLKNEYYASLPNDNDGKNIGELLMFSCHPDGRCRIKNGEFEGKTLAEILSGNRSLMGSHAEDFRRFPLMIRLIDSRDGTSAHVHADDEYGLSLADGQGKIDIWYIIDAEPDAEIVCGFTEELTQEQLRRRVEDGTVDSFLKRVPVKEGDSFVIEPGVVHAVGKGVLLCEVSQSSNISFRLSEPYMNLDDNERRQLSVPEVIDIAITTPYFDVSETADRPEDSKTRKIRVIGSCTYFKSVMMEISGRTHLSVTLDSFLSLIVIGGSGKVITGSESVSVEAGDSLFVPAGTGRVTINGNIKFVATTI